MELYSDILKARPLAEECIGKYGYAAEHNFDHYTYTGAIHEAPYFISFPDGTGLLVFHDGKKWEVFSEPLAPEGRRAAVLLEFISEVLRDPAIEKVVLELHQSTRRELLKILPEALRARAINYTMTWPVFDLVKFDPALPGGRYKDLRNARNAFYRDHKVEVKNAADIPKDDLRSIVSTWKERRRAEDRAYTGMYLSYIDHEFAGTTSARALVVDGHVAGINAGWRIPNTEKYYAAIGLHDYSFRDLGDMLNLEDLAFLKQAGYTHADFAGGEEALTRYKLKFGEAETYSSFVFSVGRNNN